MFLGLFARQSVSLPLPFPCRHHLCFSSSARSYQGLPSSRIPGCRFMLAGAERARREKLRRSVETSWGSQLLWKVCCSCYRHAVLPLAGSQLSTPVHVHTHAPSLPLSLSTHTHTHTHTHTQGPYVPASPVTGPHYRSIIYLRPLTLRIRSRFSPIMASLAQHPASIKAYPEMSPTHTHTHTHTCSSQNNVISLTPRCGHTYSKNGAYFKKNTHAEFNYIFTGSVSFFFSFQGDIYIIWKNRRLRV